MESGIGDRRAFGGTPVDSFKTPEKLAPRRGFTKSGGTWLADRPRASDGQERDGGDEAPKRREQGPGPGAAMDRPFTAPCYTDLLQSGSEFEGASVLEF